jgi:DNA-binding CsgD family transcriptional regulator
MARPREAARTRLYEPEVETTPCGGNALADAMPLRRHRRVMKQNAHAAGPLTDASVQDRIHLLWDQLAGFEAARGEVALMHLLGEVANLVGAQNAYWMGAVRLIDDARDPLHGWRPRLIRYLRPLPNDENFTQQRLKQIQRGRIDEATVAQARLAGTFRACRLRDLVSTTWFSSDAYQGYLGRGIHDSLSVAVPVSPTAESYYGFLRMRENEPFTETQRDVAYHAMRGLTWFHRQVLLAHGVLAAGTPLSPTERKVLGLLLTDRSEKLIAADLGVTASTLHTYVRGVLRKFGVRGRSGLISLWLGRSG